MDAESESAKQTETTNNEWDELNNFAYERDINDKNGKERTFSEMDVYPRQPGESSEDYGKRLKRMHELTADYQAEEAEKARIAAEEQAKKDYYESEFGQKELAEQAEFDRISEKLDQAVAEGRMTEEHAEKLAESQLDKAVSNIDDYRQDYQDRQTVGPVEDQQNYEAWLKKHNAENEANLENRESNENEAPAVDSQPESSETVSTQTTAEAPEAQPVAEETEPQKNLDAEIKRYELNKKMLGDVVSELVERDQTSEERGAAEVLQENNQRLNEISNELTERGETQAEAERTPAVQQRGRKVLDALSRRRVELAQRRAHHARVETFDSSYQINHNESESDEPNEPTAESQPKPIEDTTNQVDAEVAESVEAPEAPEAQPVAEETEPQNDLNVDKKRYELNKDRLKDVLSELKEQGAIQVDEAQNATDHEEVEQNTFPEGVLTPKDMQEIVGDAYVTQKLQGESSEQLQSEYEEYSRKEKILESLLKMRRGEPINASDIQILSENKGFAEEFSKESDTELAREYAENHYNAHHREVELMRRDRLSEPSESAA